MTLNGGENIFLYNAPKIFGRLFQVASLLQVLARLLSGTGRPALPRVNADFNYAPNEHLMPSMIGGRCRGLAVV